MTNHNSKSGQSLYRCLNKLTGVVIATISIISVVTVFAGDLAPIPHHYRPAERGVWDTWYVQEGETTHVFYLQTPIPGTTADPKESMGVGHAVSRDLVNWTELNAALVPGDPKAARAYDEGQIYTGCAVLNEGKFFLFYCGNQPGASAPGNPLLRQSICLATSTDGKNFTKYENNPVIEPTVGKYFNWFEKTAPFPHWAHDWLDCRDMYVIKDPESDYWLGYVVMRRQDAQDAEHSCCISLSRSRDLYHWEVGDPVCTPNRFNCFEVPDVFCLNDRWFMLALTADHYGQDDCWFDPDISGATLVFEADSPYGPFEEVRDNLVLANKNKMEGYSARSIDYNGKRLMFYTHKCPEEIGNRLAWPVLLEAKENERGLWPCYWSGIDSFFVNSISKDTIVWSESGNNTTVVKEFPAGESTCMLKADIEFEREAGFVINCDEENINSGLRIILERTTDARLRTVVRDAENKELTSRYLERVEPEKQNLRLIVDGRIIQIYVNDILMLNRYCPEETVGAIGVTQTGPGTISDLRYYSWKESGK